MQCQKLLPFLIPEICPFSREKQMVLGEWDIHVKILRVVTKVAAHNLLLRSNDRISFPRVQSGRPA